jgi:adenylate cyclase
VKKRLIFILFGLIAAAVAFGAYRYAPPALQQLDYRLKDARFRVRGPITPTKQVVVVAIDHKSIKEVGRWPWPRTVTAQLIDQLARYGAKVTALDIVFSEQQDPVSDAALSAAVTTAGNVVLGYFFRDEEQPIEPVSLLQLESAKVKLIRAADGVTSIPLNEYRSVDTNLALIGKGARDFGFFNARPDGDGLYRRSLLLLLYNGDIYPSLAMKALRHYLGQEIMLDIQPWGVDAVQLGALRVPSREDGTMALNYYGPAGSFQTISASDVINKRLPPDALNGAIVFVGATEIGIFDIRPTPFDATQPGVELHATVAANALDGRFLRHDGTTQTLELISLVSLPVVLGVGLAFVPGTLAGLAVFGGMALLFWSVNYWAFVQGLRDMTLLYPVLGLGLTYLASEAWRNLVVERKGRQLKKAFSNYVSPDLVKQIEKNPDQRVLGGEQRELSILFSDIRGFTTVSEDLTPPELVALLNEYLSPMTRIVLEERGTLDKFIGDAVMAIFNAPLDVPHHAVHACCAAVRMLEELERLNQGFVSRGMHTLDIGIGINTGPAVVGNMGADIRFDYTAIGDSVNLASRLEGLNKLYGSHILVSEDTRQLVPSGLFAFREVDRVRVKGKHQPVKLFELLVHKQELIPRFEEALEQYRAKEFTAAQCIFDELAQQYDDGPSRLYSSRCAEYLLTPPPDGWDGIFTAKSK